MAARKQKAGAKHNEANRLPAELMAMARMVKPNKSEFEEMLEEATVDCYTDGEAFLGVLYTLQDKLKFPFMAEASGWAKLA